jgi:hypothetical protein
MRILQAQFYEGLQAALWVGFAAIVLATVVTPFVIWYVQ